MAAHSEEDRLSAGNRNIVKPVANAARICIAWLTFVGLSWTVADAATRARAQSWLIVSDIHVDPTGRSNGRAGEDSNPALVASTIAQMRRVEARPPVIVVVGDLLAHHFDAARASSTIVGLAHQFDRAFPNAQFVFVLGNEDSDCGDYGAATGSAFLRTVARAWAPLVNRHNASPAFSRTFSRDGFYVTKLPLGRLRAIALDDVFWSPRYHSGCGGSSNPSLQMLKDLDGALPTGRNIPSWVIAHIPPGIDAYSTTQISHNLLEVPFLKPRAKDRFVSLVGDSARHVALLVTGHTHRFAFRVIGAGPSAVPVLLAPAISPIFRNAPSFLRVSVDIRGTIGAIDEWSLRDGTWRALGGLRSLRMHDLSGGSVLDLERRLARDGDLRKTYARLYAGGSRSEINASNWSTYRCVISTLTTSEFRNCTAEGGIGIVTDKGLRVTAVLAGCAAVFVALCFIAWRAVRRRRRGTI